MDAVDQLTVTGFRFLFALVVAVSLPMAHSYWGEAPPPEMDGPHAFAILIGSFVFWGMAIAAGYFVIGSIAQFVWRYRLSRSVAFDIGTCIAAVCLCIWLGVSANYTSVN